MSSGKPDFQKLYEMGKLPKEQIKNLPWLSELTSVKDELEAIKAALCGECKKKVFGGTTEEPSEPAGATIEKKCEQCDVVISAGNEAWLKRKMAEHVRSEHYGEKSS